MTRGLDEPRDVKGFEVEQGAIRSLLRAALGTELKNAAMAKCRKKDDSAAASVMQDALAAAAPPAAAVPRPRAVATPARPRTTADASPRIIAAAADFIQQVEHPKPHVRAQLEVSGVSVMKVADRDARETEIRDATAKQYAQAGAEALKDAMEVDNKAATGRNLQAVYGSKVSQAQARRNASHAAHASKGEGGKVGGKTTARTEKFKATTPVVVRALEKIGSKEKVITSAEKVLAAGWDGLSLKDMEGKMLTGFWTAFARENRLAFTSDEEMPIGKVAMAGRVMKVLLEDATGMTFKTRQRTSKTTREMKAEITLPSGSIHELECGLPNLSVRSPSRRASNCTAASAAAETLGARSELADPEAVLQGRADWRRVAAERGGGGRAAGAVAQHFPHGPREQGLPVLQRVQEGSR